MTQSALLTGLTGVLWDTLAQAFILIGGLLILASAHGILERLSRNMLTRAFGWWSVLWTGWIGVPIHEMSHLVACKIFRHRVESISLFSPNPHTGTLGYVNHTWNPKSRYQRAGNFAIGIAPVLGGAATLILLTRLLPSTTILDEGSRTISAFLASPTPQTGLALLSHYALDLPLTLFSQLSSWKLWLVLYLLMAVSLHMSPSREDLSGTWWGFALILCSLLLLNLIALPFGGIPDSALHLTAHLVAPAAAALLMALVLNLTVLALVFALTQVARHLKSEDAKKE